MSAKRAHTEDTKEEEEHPTEPYQTYIEVHQALLAPSTNEFKLKQTAQRAQQTITTHTIIQTIRQTAVRLVTRLCSHPAIDTVSMVTVLIEALAKSEPSVRCEVYQSLVILDELKSSLISTHVPQQTKQTLVTSIHSDINHPQHHLRCACLGILPTINPPDLLGCLCNYTIDSHPRVRQAALSVIQRQHTMGNRLPVEVYDDCVVASKDDYEQVRLIAIELIWTISSMYPKHPVIIQGQQSIRLVDDGFVKICDMVNDTSVVVRQRACRLLGRFKQQVGDQFLSQTFSKQVMSHLRRFNNTKRGYVGRNKGVKSTNTLIPTPEGDVDVASEEFKLLDSGAAGALVHGLEDEFQEVRDAAIESITQLSTSSEEFANRAVDFLVDMFNDSSDRVRLCAIDALESLGTRRLIQLTQEQLSIALSAMKDSHRIIRTGIYSFLSVCRISQSEQVLELMRGFQSNLGMYPEDQQDIYLAIRKLGRHHSIIVTRSEFVRRLLGLSKQYLNREARIDDIIYAGSVILVANSNQRDREKLKDVLPDYVYSHLPYLRDKYPDSLPKDIVESVPQGLEFVKRMLELPRVNHSISRLSLVDFQQSVDKAFHKVQDTLQGGSDKLLAKAIREYAEMTKDQELSIGTRNLHQTVIEYGRLVGFILKAQQQPNKDKLELSAKILAGSYQLESRTMGLNPECRLALVYLRLFSHVLWYFSQQDSLKAIDRRLRERVREELLDRVSRNHRLLEANCPRELQNLKDRPEELSEFIRGFSPLKFIPRAQLQHVSAQLDNVPTRPQEYNYRFPLNLSINSQINWVPKRTSIRLSIRCPTVPNPTLLSPPSTALRPIPSSGWQLEWQQVPVSLPLGSGESVSTMDVTICIRHRLDIPWTDHLILDQTRVSASYPISSYFQALKDPQLGYLAIDISPSCNFYFNNSATR